MECELPVAYYLYLPEAWANDAERRQQAGIPEQVRFQTKLEMALGQIRQTLAMGIAQGTVLADPAYGNDTGFRQQVAGLELSYVLGVQSTTTIWPPGTQPLSRSQILGTRSTGEPPTPRSGAYAGIGQATGVELARQGNGRP